MFYSLLRTFVLIQVEVILNPTKARILKTALTLFNERGSGNVSTRHIAEELTMSPGNLYYHYAHKEAIIQALFIELDKTWDEAYAYSPDEPLTLIRITQMLEVTFEIVWQYRFFYREMTLLVYNDPTLAKHYHQAATRVETGTALAVQSAVASGVLKPLSSEAKNNLTLVLIIVSNHWLNFKEMSDKKINKGVNQQGVKLLVSLLEPHLTPKAKAEYAALVAAPKGK
jgi:AcrR family transcriptional regulator